MIDLLCHKFLTLFYLIHLIFWVSVTQKKSQNDKFEVKILPEQILNISIYFYLFYFKKIKFMIAHVNEMLIGLKRKILKIQCYSTLFFRSMFFFLLTMTRTLFWSRLISCIFYQLVRASVRCIVSM